MSLICTGKYNEKLKNSGHPDGLSTMEIRKVGKYFGISSIKRSEICRELLNRKYKPENILSVLGQMNRSEGTIQSGVNNVGGTNISTTIVQTKFQQEKYIPEYILDGYEVRFPELRKTPLKDYQYSYPLGTMDKSYNYEKSSFAQVNCGLNFSKWYRVQNVLCTALALEPLESFLNYKPCNPVGAGIGANLVRVSSQRIFADPIRSLLEPISNSIDAYSRLKGLPEIGKFGMGFFSILYWLTSPNDYLLLDSIHRTKDGRFCHWNAKILFHEGEYFFTLYDSYILVPQDNLRTRTTITLYTQEPKFKDVKLNEAIFNAFGSLLNVTILVGKTKKEGIEKGIFLPENNMTSIVNNGIIAETIYVNYDSNYVQYFDLATGIDINTFVTSMLIPTISTKPSSSKIGFRSPSRIRSGDNKLYITVGDITVLIISDIPNYFNPFYSRSKFKPEKRYDYILSLPSNTPMPVSRDDITLENPVFFEIARREFVHLLESALVQGNIETLFRLVYIYSNSSGTPEIYKLVNILREYIQNHPYIYLVPRGYDNLYSSLSKELKDNFFIPSDLPDYDKVRNLVLSKLKSYDNYIQNHKVISLKLKGNKVSNGGISDLLFVDTSLKDTYRILQEAKPLILATRDEGLPRNYIQARSRIISSKDLIFENVNILLGAVRVAEFKENLKDYFLDELITYAISIMFSAYSLSESREFLNEYTNLMYSMLIRIVNRSVQYTGNPRTSIYVNNSPYVAGSYVYPKLNKINKKPINIANKPTLKYLLNYASIFVNITASIDKNIVTVRDPFNGHIFNYLGKYENLNEIINFIINIHPIYSYYFSLIYHDWYSDFERKRVDLLSLLNYVYYELSNRYSIATLLEAPSQIFQVDILESENGIRNILNTLNTSLEIYKELTLGTLRKFQVPEINNQVYITEFKGSQLLNFLFQNNVDFNTVNWVFLISNYPSMSSDFKIYEIAINDGTTNSFAKSIITELLQNSIDATRLNRSDGNFINLGIEEFDGKGIISMKDDIGIPLPGIISILIPFLSTKVSQSELVTGEMGTGFMNVFRQPYTRAVEIYTTDPNNHHFFNLSITPIIVDSRVSDISVVFRISQKSWEKKGTLVAIQLNEMEQMKQSSILSEATVFARNNFGISSECTKIPIQINGLEQKLDLIQIFDNEFATAYLTRTEDVKTPSILLTNGIPFAELENISKMLWENRFNWLTYVYPFGIYLNLKKNNYKPVQSRKDIIMDEKDKDILKALINLICVIRILQRTADGKIDDYFLPGLSYSGSMDQVMPETILGKNNGYATGKNAAESVMKNIGIQYSISEIIRALVEILSKENKNPTRENVIGLLQKYPNLPMFYEEAILKWFDKKSGKTVIKDAVILGVGDGTQGVVNKVSTQVNFDPNKSKNIMYLINRMVNHVWRWARKNQKNININAPSMVYVDDLGGMEGVYDPGKHTIQISLSKVNIQNYEKYAKEYIELWTKNRERATIYFLNSRELNSILGAQTIAPVIIHELGHAISNTSHSGNAHGNITFSVGKEKFTFPFDKGCCEMWERALLDFSPS